MGSFSKQKGKRGEQEIARLLRPLVGEVYESFGLPAPEIYRNQNQSAIGGYDLDGLDWLAIEVKRHETLSVNAWWKQTVQQAKSCDRTPVLIYRQSRQKWRVRMPGFLGVSHPVIVEIAIDDFLEYVRTELTYRLEVEL